MVVLQNLCYHQETPNVKHRVLGSCAVYLSFPPDYFIPNLIFSMIMSFSPLCSSNIIWWWYYRITKHTASCTKGLHKIPFFPTWLLYPPIPQSSMTFSMTIIGGPIDLLFCAEVRSAGLQTIKQERVLWLIYAWRCNVIAYSHKYANDCVRSIFSRYFYSLFFQQDNLIIAHTAFLLCAL